MKLCSSRSAFTRFSNKYLLKFPLKTILLVLLLQPFLQACLFAPSPSAIKISFESRDSLAFTGRGAAAGIMLDSVMGAGGIAIGIAIDEGIAKEISTNLHAYSKDFSIQHTLRSQIDKSIDKNLLEIKVKNYGFRTYSKGEDQISAWLDLEFVCNNKSYAINYPQDFSDTSSIDFATIKVDGKASYDLLNQSVIQIFKKWKSDGQCTKNQLIVGGSA
jgi:hypothetical protein